MNWGILCKADEFLIIHWSVAIHIFFSKCYIFNEAIFKTVLLYLCRQF